MGLFSRWQKKSAPRDTNDILRELMGRASSKSGVAINYKTVMQLTTAQACMRVIAEDIAQIPFKLYKARAGGGSDPARNHPLYDLVKARPNQWQTSFEMFEQIALHLVLMNNAYVFIVRSGNTITELLPLEPQLVKPLRVGWETNYTVTLADGSTQTYDQSAIWHLKGPSWNGWQGLDGVRLMREAVGLSLSLEEHGSRMFSNGATVGGVLSTEATLNDDQVKRLRQSWEERQSGAENAYKTAVMWGGMKWQPMAHQNDQAQFLETRGFQVEEVCRAFKVMPIMVGHSNKTSSYASAEQMFLAHLRNTMGPWFSRIEQSADCNLITNSERYQGYYHKFSRNAYLTSIAKDRMEFYRGMYGIGALNPNEIRGLEDMNPYDGGENYRVPMNMEDPNTVNQNTGNTP